MWRLLAVPQMLDGIHHVISIGGLAAGDDGGERASGCVCAPKLINASGFSIWDSAALCSHGSTGGRGR